MVRFSFLKKQPRWILGGILAIFAGGALLTSCGSDVCALGFGQCAKMAEKKPSKNAKATTPSPHPIAKTPTKGPTDSTPLSLQVPGFATHHAPFRVRAIGGTPGYQFTVEKDPEVGVTITPIGTGEASIQTTGEAGVTLRIHVTDAIGHDAVRELKVEPYG